MRKILLMLISIAMAATAIACSDGKTVTHNNDPYLSLKDELAQIPEDYLPEQAVEDGCFVLVHGSVPSGRKLADDFISKTKKGTPDALRIVQYTVEGDPIITQVVFDGTIFYSIMDISRDAYKGQQDDYIESSYPYLETYRETNETTKETFDTVYLTDRRDVTLPELETMIEKEETPENSYRILYSLSTD